MPVFVETWPFWARSLTLLTAAIGGGYALRWAIQALVQWSAPRSQARLVNAFGRRAANPLGWLLSLALVQAVLAIAMPAEWLDLARRATWSAQILVLAWFIGRLLLVAEEVIVSRLGVDRADNLEARKIQTQLRVVRQLLVIGVYFLAVVVVLMSFEPLRDLGTGLLASAGIAGIVLGLAAQRTLSNIFAGFLLAFTQPIRMDDVVIVEGEWGRVEEITLTYVVVKIWDLRRLVVPIGYFLDHPFQNWTRTEAKILGSVILFVDYRVPIDSIRAETERIVTGHPEWDGDVCGVQVVDATSSAVQVRLLISANDSGAAWNLRCYLREKIIRWLAEQHPEALPRIRAQLEPDRPAAAEPWPWADPGGDCGPDSAT